MERKISFSKLQQVVNEAYEKFKTLEDGEVDARVAGADTSKFGISVVLTNGRTITVGDTGEYSPMGSVSKVPLLATLLEQRNPDDKKKCGCGCSKRCGEKPKKPHIGLSPKGIRLTSAIQPQGDPDGKMDIITSTIVGMAGEPVLDDKLYRSLIEKTNSENAINMLADAQFELFDDTASSIDVYAKVSSLTLSVTQYATLAATVAADGYNPISSGNVFDGEYAKVLAAYMAVKGPHKIAKPWLMKTGLPAVSSYGGVIVGVLPGTFGIAAYSPAVGPTGVSVRAKKALKYIMRELDLSALSSARVEVVDD